MVRIGFKKRHLVETESTKRGVPTRITTRESSGLADLPLSALTASVNLFIGDAINQGSVHLVNILAATISLKFGFLACKIRQSTTFYSRKVGADEISSFRGYKHSSNTVSGEDVYVLIPNQR
jgi:hypothetical protein